MPVGVAPDRLVAAKMVDLLEREHPEDEARALTVVELARQFGSEEQERALGQLRNPTSVERARAAALREAAAHAIDSLHTDRRVGGERRSGVDRRRRDHGSSDGVERRLRERRSGVDRRREDMLAA
jgi:hypothetical protein